MAFLILKLWICTPEFIQSGKGLAQGGFYTLVWGLCCIFHKGVSCMPLNPLTSHGCITLEQLLLKTTKFQIYITKHTGLTQNTFYFSPYLPLAPLYQSLLSSPLTKLLQVYWGKHRTLEQKQKFTLGLHYNVQHCFGLPQFSSNFPTLDPYSLQI